MKANLGLGWVWWVVLGEIVFLGLEARPPGMAAAPVPVAAMQALAQPVERVSLQPVLDFQPFGAAPVVAEPSTDEAPQPAPEPASQPRGLALQGVLLPGSGAARVLLSMDGGPAQSYAKGDLLPGGGRLIDVAVDQIWIEIGGERQALGFVEPGPSAPTPVLEDGADGSETSDLDPAPEPAVEPLVKPAKTGKAFPQPDLRNLIPDLTNAAAQDP
jgi:hypothetical protein